LVGPKRLGVSGLDALQRYLEVHQDKALDLLRRLVELESPSRDKQRLDHLAKFLVDQLAGLGFTVEVFAQAERGNHIYGRRGHGERALILLHYDTVWPAGETERRPFRIEDGRAFGPGVFDMKGGIAAIISAISALDSLGRAIPGELAVLITSDEEISSGSSRALIERLVSESRYVLVPEPAPKPNTVITSRKGGGNSFVTIHGRSAHAGRDHEKGINALVEASHQILHLSGLTNYSTGTTVNVGYARGGTGLNVVPDQIEIGVDFRFTTQAEGERIEALIRDLKPVNPGIKLEVTGGVHRAPLVRLSQSGPLIALAVDIGAELGLDLVEVSTGGGSDGNFSAALGVPTLDGLGPPGDGAHALHEHVLISEFPRRAALIGHLLLRA